MPLFRYFLSVAFDGTVFHGWQAQKNAPSVQQLLTDSLSMMMRLPLKLTGAGRTDAGVHARQFFAHVDIPVPLSTETRQKLVYKLNGFLPPQVAVFDIIPVKADAHARFSAISRTYRYYISTVKDPFSVNHFWHYTGKLDLDLMNEGARILPEIMDFTSFSKVDTDTNTNICKVTMAGWEQNRNSLVFTITADRFLRNMVRAIVGTLLELGRHKITIPGFRQIIACNDRSEAGDSVPAQGLFLEKIVYPEEIWNVESDSK